MVGSYRPSIAITSVTITSVALLAALLLSGSADPGKRRFFLEPTLRLPADTVHQYLVLQEDSIPNDTLFQIRSREGFPLAYYRKVNTNVCFDGKCRMLDVWLYWNITGRYLGIELPPGEFLSKSDHERFNHAEYDRMNKLLADSLSPLADFTFEELVPSSGDPFPSSGTNELTGFTADAVTSPTAPAMKEYVVEGAAYTTYRLWHFVYGPSREEIIRLTEEALSPPLLQKILESPDKSDVAWALQRMQGYTGLSTGLQKTVLGFIRDEDYSMANMAIKALNPADLASASLQHALLEKLPGLNYSLKNRIIDKLKEAPDLDEKVKIRLANNLAAAEGSFLTNILDLFDRQSVDDDETCRVLSGLLQHANQFVAGKIFNFLEKAGSEDETVRERMAQYKQKN
ncbi:hypothetical protein EDD80_103195 [Anseongella ginsenosidimutans]|uniref:Uncharacterized protein n=1 Tax=Anseongella ginsenosidimutans TaxID=496056 RepID=A0A4R3KWM6_9SPHI|nr:hypothetical protein [Anseongella ginsenosidimutans]QEC53441.1 hypothetical protein FRZ59_14580 [Anseongella ginsenosidimutans]TCS88331.1 hypothetical protein EDD80_103195 [Anseongella ginsenosidimutans]